MVSIRKNGVEYVYKSLNNACNENGATSGMNRGAQLKYLTRAGFDITTLVEDKKETATRSPSATLIEKIIKEATEIDKKTIKVLEEERMDLIKNLKVGKNIDKILAINAKIEMLENPKIDLATVLAYVEKLFNEHQAKNSTETPPATAPATAETEGTA